MSGIAVIVVREKCESVRLIYTPDMAIGVAMVLIGVSLCISADLGL